MAREYNNSTHALNIAQETERAVAVKVNIDFCDLEFDKSQLVWIPKSLLVEGRAPGWILNKKLNEVIEAARSLNKGAVVARFV